MCPMCPKCPPDEVLRCHTMPVTSGRASRHLSGPAAQTTCAVARARRDAALAKRGRRQRGKEGRISASLGYSLPAACSGVRPKNQVTTKATTNPMAIAMQPLMKFAWSPPAKASGEKRPDAIVYWVTWVSEA